MGVHPNLSSRLRNQDAASTLGERRTKSPSERCFAHPAFAGQQDHPMVLNVCFVGHDLLPVDSMS